MLRIIGIMTGNSMDAIDLVLTEFDGDDMCDICAYSKPYSKSLQIKMEELRGKVFNKSKAEIMRLPEFRVIHDMYIRGVAESVEEMCALNNINKADIDAIGFHGKTLDHNPPSRAEKNKTRPYTLQIGSGQMLADLTGIPVVYDFRSDLLMAGFEGAPLVLPHNAHIARIEGDGCYYNGGNTSNFAVVSHGKAIMGADAGPFNEYIDNYVRLLTKESFDRDGMFGQKGKLSETLLQKLFDFGRDYYEMNLPKSGDPAYYHKDEVFQYVKAQGIRFEDAVYTFEYFAAYIAVLALTLIPDDIVLPRNIILFGGGWKNPIVRKSFDYIIQGKGVILPGHKDSIKYLGKRVDGDFNIRYSAFGEYMEARLFADMARYKLEDKVWEIPELVKSEQKVICGVVARPGLGKKYNDSVNRAAKGWQK